MLTRLTSAVLVLALAVTMAAQDVRDLSTPTAHITKLGASIPSINSTIQQGYRLTNLTYRGPGIFGSTFDAVFVKNTGAYASSWWWYVGQTVPQISSLLTTNQARLIDLDPYIDTAGNLRYACIMVNNTGANQKVWWWYVGSTVAQLSTSVSANNARVVDLDRYTANGVTRYSAIMIRNTGADQRPWWWYVGVTPSQISSLINTNNARLYDLEPLGSGTYACVLVADSNPPNWHWWYDMSSSDVLYLINQYGVRPIDLETYLVGTARKWAMVTINNSNALTTSVGSQMRAATNGQIGLWMERVNGANLANLNGDTVFEPASTMKTFHHLHAMREVSLGLPLTTPLTVYNNYFPVGSSCPVDTGPFSEPLQTVLSHMMEASDNARTQAVRAYFGQSNINTTASAVGTTSTVLRHRIGCGTEALANPNDTTLRDLHIAHEAVSNGFLGSSRQAFYDLMRNDLLELDDVINDEGTSLGLSTQTLQSFRSLTEVAHKKGGYGLSSGGAAWFNRSDFGWISVPFLVGSSVIPHEYSFGAWVNNASTDSGAVAAVYDAGLTELLRPTIRSALMSWGSSLATVASVGTGCGIPTCTQGVTGLPRLGSTVLYNSATCQPSLPVLFAIGFSDTLSGPLPLPFALAAIGGEVGCFAYNDIVISDATLASSSGSAQFAVALPSSTANIGFEYWTQFYSFGPTSFRTSNSLHSTVGF